MRRDDIDIVINACELTTGSAFRFGSQHSATWRVGEVIDSAAARYQLVA